MRNEISNNPETLSLELVFVRYLMASYLYYIMDLPTPWMDEEYDYACRRLAEHWDEFEHRHKHLASIDDLEAGTGYTINNYPRIVESSAMQWLREYQVVNGQ